MCEKPTAADAAAQGARDFLFMLAFFGGLILGIIAANLACGAMWRHDAIMHDAAYYDAQTARFRWNDQLGERQPLSRNAP